MRSFSTIAARLSPATLLPILLFCTTGCSAYNNNGAITFAGIIYVILGIAALISLLKQDWSLTKKLIWGAIIWFIPIPGLGAILYFLFSGRSK